MSEHTVLSLIAASLNEETIRGLCRQIHAATEDSSITPLVYHQIKQQVIRDANDTF